MSQLSNLLTKRYDRRVLNENLNILEWRQYAPVEEQDNTFLRSLGVCCSLCYETSNCSFRGEKFVVCYLN